MFSFEYSEIFLRTPIFKNICERLLLHITNFTTAFCLAITNLILEIPNFNKIYKRLLVKRQVKTPWGVPKDGSFVIFFTF